MKSSLRVLLTCTAACTAAPNLGQTTAKSEATNGASLNGASLNGASLNGASLNGASLNGASLNGASLNGASLNGASLNGLELVGSTFEADDVDDLVGAILVGELSDGRTMNLRIDDVQFTDDVALYAISVGVDQGWAPLCEDAGGDNLPAIALAGSWNYSSNTAGGGSKDRSSGLVTLACRGGALAKCVENVGYKPWLSATHDSLHQTCTRTLRADYCGNGTSWTWDGRLINLYDDHDIQDDTKLWLPEAEWTESGARCIFHQRVIDLGSGLPSCLLAKLGLLCGLFPAWDHGTLITNEAFDIGIGL